MPETLEPPEPAEPREVYELTEALRESNERGGRMQLATSIAISALTIVSALLVFFSIRAQASHSYAQNQADVFWQVYFQRRLSITMLSAEKDLLEASTPTSDKARETIDKKMDSLKNRTEKWSADIMSDQERARQFEEEAEHSEARAARISLGQILLQIAVLVCSITFYTRRRLFLYLGSGVGTLGLLTALTAWLIN